jgi:hypothetical protein
MFVYILAITRNYWLRGNIPVPGAAPGALAAWAWPLSGRLGGRYVLMAALVVLAAVAVTLRLVRRLMCLAHRAVRSVCHDVSSWWLSALCRASVLRARQAAGWQPPVTFAEGLVSAVVPDLEKASGCDL